MNIYETVQYLTKQANLNADRAKNGQTEVEIRSYATRADIYFVLATALCVCFGSAAPSISPDLGDAEDKAKQL